MTVKGSAKQTGPTKRPWYKEFWCWFVFAPPILVVPMGLGLVYTAVTNQDPLVIDDHYDTGRATYRNFERELVAYDMGLSARVRVPREGGELALVLQGKNAEAQPERLRLTLEPRTGADDVVAEVELGADGVYRGQVRPVANRRYLHLEPMDGRWRIIGELDATQVHTELEPRTDMIRGLRADLGG